VKEAELTIQTIRRLASSACAIMRLRSMAQPQHKYHRRLRSQSACLLQRACFGCNQSLMRRAASVQLSGLSASASTPWQTQRTIITSIEGRYSFLSASCRKRPRGRADSESHIVTGCAQPLKQFVCCNGRRGISRGYTRVLISVSLHSLSSLPPSPSLSRALSLPLPPTRTRIGYCGLYSSPPPSLFTQHLLVLRNRQIRPKSGSRAHRPRAPGPRRARRAPGPQCRASGRSGAQEHAGSASVGPLGPD